MVVVECLHPMELAIFQIVKNMVYLAKMYHTSDAAADDRTAITVSWMARKLMKEANLEKINSPQITLKVGLRNVLSMANIREKN